MYTRVTWVLRTMKYVRFRARGSFALSFFLLLSFSLFPFPTLPRKRRGERRDDATRRRRRNNTPRVDENEVADDDDDDDNDGSEDDNDVERQHNYDNDV